MKKELTIDQENFHLAGDAFEKLGVSELADIFRKYELYKDIDIRDQMYNWLTNFQQSLDEDDDNKRKKKFIEIQESCFDIYYIKSFEKNEFYDFYANNVTYELVINEVDAKSSYIREVKIKFKDKQERDNQYNILKAKLIQWNVNFL